MALVARLLIGCKVALNAIRRLRSRRLNVRLRLLAQVIAQVIENSDVLNSGAESQQDSVAGDGSGEGNNQQSKSRRIRRPTALKGDGRKAKGRSR